MKITEEIYMFDRSGLHSNCYLVLGEVPFLVDTGDGSTSEELVNFISEHIQPSELKYIINTHCHFDHISGNSFIKEKTGASLAAHSEDAVSIEDADEKTYSGMSPNQLDSVTVEKKLLGGEMFGDFEVIHTPGHSAGGICLYSEEGILISGDTLFADGNVGRTDLNGSDFQKLKESILKLSKLKVEKILPGHGSPATENCNEVIKKALELVNRI